MKYYICSTAKRKNAKRHICSKHDSYEEACICFARMRKNIRYNWELVSGDWKKNSNGNIPVVKEN